MGAFGKRGGKKSTEAERLSKTSIRDPEGTYALARMVAKRGDLEGTVGVLEWGQGCIPTVLLFIGRSRCSTSGWPRRPRIFLAGT